MDMSLRKAASALNSTQRRATLCAHVIYCLRAAVVAVLVVAVWAILRPEQELEQLGLGGLALVVALLGGLQRRRQSAVKPQDLALALEMRYGPTQQAPLTKFGDEEPLPAEWTKALQEHHREVSREAWQRNLGHASSLLLPLALSLVTIPHAAPSLALALSEVKDVVSRLNRGATLTIEQGATSEGATNKDFVLSAKKPVTVELLAQNLIKITVTGGFGSATPIVELRRQVQADPFGKAPTQGAAQGQLPPPTTTAKTGEKEEPLADENNEEFDQIELSENTLRDTAPAETLTPSPSSPTETEQAEKPAHANRATSGAPAKEPGEEAAAAQTPPAANTAGGDGAPTEPAEKMAAGDDAKGRVFQTFQMSPLRDPQREASGQSVNSWSVAFAVAEPVDLYIPALAGESALAHLKVRQLPVPKVRLVQLSDHEDPWPDDMPLTLSIQVRAENPLQLVRLLIKSGQRTSKELVANVMAEDKKALDTDYRLTLEPYVESDMAQVEIVAEAVDRAVPTPLVGVSEPLRLNTASAYGRYRQALQTLREVKQAVDSAIEKDDAPLGEEAQNLARKAADQSERSPFFDGLDRVMIKRFEARVAALADQPSAEELFDLSQQLNDFLFEHEILDDRERDRDFFVAARGMSRVIEQAPAKRPLPVTTVTDRMKRFLDDRYERWEKRVERLPPENVPSDWARVKAQKPFHAAMNKVAESDAKAASDARMRSEQLAALSQAVVDYRTFIEDLEAQEDKAREAQEKERQEGLASSRNVLRELQQRQGEVSTGLDRASQRTKAELAEGWPTTRMKQNTNARETHRLEGQMRSLSPSAAQRIQAAAQAMEKTSEAGEDGNFVLAESASDLAGRLLRQAEQATQQSQQKRRDRGRRRRVTGDNYYGQSVVGGDIEIKREYEVDRRYREDILDEVEGSNLDDEQRSLLENYLRQVVR